MIIGFLFLIVGVLVLLKNLGFISFPGNFWSLFYPLALVVIGLYLVLAAKGGRKCMNWVKEQFENRSDENKKVG